MGVCCINLSTAARMIGLYGLVLGAVLMVEMSTEIGRVRCSIETMTTAIKGKQVFIPKEEMSGGAEVSAWLLGLSLNEFGSRVRHSMHTGGRWPPHVHINATALPETEQPLSESPSVRNQTQDLSNQTQDQMEAESQIYVGFLMYAVAYASTSALLVFGSVVRISWTCVPWLVAHLGAVSAQTARLVVQVTAVVVTVPEQDHLAPGHPDKAHKHADDQGGDSAPGALILSLINMIFLVYLWIVVIVAMRSWKKPRHVIMSTKPAKGDETYIISSSQSADYSVSYC